jgi:transposase
MNDWKAITHYAAVDWSKSKHQVVIIDREAELAEEFVFTHDSAGWAQLRERLFAYPQLALVVESGHSLVADQLLSTHALVFVLPAKKARSYRLRRSQCKTDKIDAWSLAMAVRSEGQTWEPAQSLDPLIQELRLLCRDEVTLIEERTRLVNQLQAALGDYYPVALEAFDDWTKPFTWEFLKAYPTPGQLRAAGRKKWETFLHGHNLWMGNQEKRMECFARAESLTGNKAVTSAKKMLVLALVENLECLHKQLLSYRARIEALFAEHPDHDTFNSLPGAGAKLAPRLLAELGEDRTLFPNAEALQRYAGTAPAHFGSGQIERVRLRHACNKELRASVHHWAQQASRYCPWAKLYYEKHRSLGKSHASTLRSLGQRLLKILWRIWQDHALYDEVRHNENQKKHGSWLAPLLPQPQVVV